MNLRIFPTPTRQIIIETLALWIATALLCAFAAPPTRALQLWSFTIPFGLAYLYAGRTLWSRVLLWAGCTLSWLDGAVRAFIYSVYDSDPRSGFVLESVANTHAAESLEFIMTLWSDIALWAVVFIALEIGALWLLSRPTARSEVVRSKLLAASILMLVILATTGAALRPWRAHWPVVFWPQWVQSASELRETWNLLSAERDAALELARTEITSADKTPRTLVLVIGESMVRENLGLYGYARNTTPKLSARAAKDERLVAVKNVWSTSSSTVAAFHDMFTFQAGDKTGDLLAFFQSAGWHITWISNQDDLAIKNNFAAWSDEILMLNRHGGRSSASLDEVVLTPLSEALSAKADRRLIIVHLLGIHPHYSLRYPSGWTAPWLKDKGNDAVERELKALERSHWVVKARNTYDLAVRYQDTILDATLEAATRHAQQNPGQRVDWIYVSDHGQELGRYADRTGHSNLTPDGFSVPLLLWSSDGTLRRSTLEERPFRTDRMSPLMLELGGIRTKHADPALDFLSEDYVWTPPAIPMPPSEELQS